MFFRESQSNVSLKENILTGMMITAKEGRLPAEGVLGNSAQIFLDGLTQGGDTLNDLLLGHAGVVQAHGVITTHGGPAAFGIAGFSEK